MGKVSKAEQAEAIEELRSLLKPGDTVYTRLNHVSRSGMLRVITPMIMQVDAGKVIQASGADDGNAIVTLGETELRPYYLGYLVSKALNLQDDGDQGVKIGGVGMDMGFALVYDISSVVFQGGFDCIGNRCPANDHANGENVTHHSDGGYALRQRWL